jgi:hypothetical protein
MPSTRSYQEPTPTITVEYSASTLSRWGFFPVVLQYLRRRRLPERLGQITIKTAANGVYSVVSRILSTGSAFQGSPSDSSTSGLSSTTQRKCDISWQLRRR